MMFGEIVGQISCSRAPLDVKLALFDAILYPVKRMSMDFDFFCFMFVLVKPTLVELSTSTELVAVDVPFQQGWCVVVLLLLCY
jgi:hypothetical protein